MTAESPRHNVDTDTRMQINKQTSVWTPFSFPGWYLFLSLFVELVLLLILFDDRLVSFLEVFSQDDIPVLTYSQHASLRRHREKLT